MEVDKYFSLFEKVAQSMKWPKDAWTLLLQSGLVGKVRAVYSALSVEDSGQYEVVKMNILKAYELVPEAYWQKFWNTKKTDKQTYVEFGREKEMLFDRWCLSKDISQNYLQLCQLMLLKEFKNCLPVDIKTYVDEQKIEDLHQAATLADDYALTHTSQFGRVSQSVRENQRSPGDSHPSIPNSHSNSRDQNEPNRRSPRFPSGPTCFYCKKKVTSSPNAEL